MNRFFKWSIWTKNGDLGCFYEKNEKTMIKYHEKSRLILFIVLLESKFYADSNGEVYFLRSLLYFFILLCIKKHIHSVDHGIMFILKKVIFLDFRIVDQIHYTKFDVKLTGKIFRL